MTGSRVALTERGPGAKRVSSQNRMLGSFGQPGAQQLECMASWRQRLEQHTSCVAEELEDDGIHTIGIHLIERVACSRASHATVRTRATLGSEATRVQVPAREANQSCTLQYGESENIGKMTGSRMALIEHGQGAMPVSSNSHARRLDASSESQTCERRCPSVASPRRKKLNEQPWLRLMCAQTKL
jgi:hypothetical protein